MNQRGAGIESSRPRVRKTQSARPIDDIEVHLANARVVLTRLAGGPLPDWEALASRAVLQQVNAGTTLYKTGDRHEYYYLVVGGLLKAISSHGKLTRVFGFLRPGEIIGPRPVLPRPWRDSLELAYVRPVPAVAAALDGYASHNLMTTTNSVLLRVSATAIDHLVQRHHRWMRLAFSVSAYQLAARAARVEDLLVLSPEEHYLRLAAEEPDILRLAPQRDIASLIGISPEALSRITARIRERERNVPSAAAG